MADETVDVVNEDDEVVRQECKSVCHKEGYWHRVSAVYLFDSKGRIWLQTRAKHKISGGKLDASAAGHLGAGDTYEEAAYREMQEEIGVHTPLELITEKLAEIADQEEFRIRHIASVFKGIHDGPFTLQKEEVEEIQAYEIEEIKNMIAHTPERFPSGVIQELQALLAF